MGQGGIGASARLGRGRGLGGTVPWGLVSWAGSRSWAAPLCSAPPGSCVCLVCSPPVPVCCGGGAACVVFGGLLLVVLCVAWLGVGGLAGCGFLCAFLLRGCLPCLPSCFLAPAGLGVAGWCAVCRLRCVVLCAGWVRGWLVRLPLLPDLLRAYLVFSPETLILLRYGALFSWRGP